MAGFRTIVLNRRCKLESQLGSLLIRGETEERIHIREIETLIVESTAVALTAALVADLTEAGANIIFCDRRHLPSAVFLPVHSHFSAAKNIKEQIGWSDTRKAECRRLIIREKIRQQALRLAACGENRAAETLTEYARRVGDGDEENLEARAAAAYFKAVFGAKFSRNESCFFNDALNYGYSLILSAFAREISACGYLTELGLWHKGAENAFNLASDLMEPFRAVCDGAVIGLTEEEQKNAYKRELLSILFSQIKIDGEKQSFVPAVRIYLHRIFRFMRGEVGDIFQIEILGAEEA